MYTRVSQVYLLLEDNPVILSLLSFQSFDWKQGDNRCRKWLVLGLTECSEGGFSAGQRKLSCLCKEPEQPHPFFSAYTASTTTLAATGKSS